jgi:hypothetical protein
MSQASADMRSFQLIVSMALVAPLLAGAAGAQEPPARAVAVIVGQVTDTLGAPLPYCFVRLENARSAVLCDSTGRFRLEGVRQELTTFEIRRLGYVAGRFTAMVLSDSMQFTIQLVPVATVLRPIGVTTPAAPPFTPWLEEHGFFRRMREGLTGIFVTPEELERLKPHRVTQVLSDRPGVKITYTQAVGGEPIPLVWGRNYCLLNVFVDGIEIKGVYTLDPSDVAQRRGGVSFYGSPGFRQQGHTGQAQSRITGLGLDGFVLPRSIAAMEIYPSGPNTPMEFRTTNECGAIVIWTKVGTRPPSADSARARPPASDNSRARPTPGGSGIPSSPR